MNPVITFEGIESNHINTDRLERTVKLVPDDPYGARGASYGDLLNALMTAGISPDEINAIFKVSANDTSYSVLLAENESVEKMHQIGRIQAGKIHFDIMKMTDQIVNLRIHWLPIFYDNSILREIFSQYGKILDIKMMKTAHEKLVAYNGVREIKMKIDEIMKHQIPHLVNFNSGQTILVTMAGRPPYCLKCRAVGHVRSRCPNNKTFAALFERGISREDQNVEVDAVIPSVAPGSSVDKSASSSEPVDLSKPVGDGTEDSGAEGSGSQDQLSSSEDIDMENEKGLKRGRTFEDSGSWIEPNKTAKSRSVSTEALDLGNTFSPIMGISDIMSQSST